MKTIYKYPLRLTDQQIVEMPKGAKLLTVQEQYGELQLWALVDTVFAMRRREVCIIGTGNPADHATGHYLATVQIEGGRLVFHVFDNGEVA